MAKPLLERSARAVTRAKSKVREAFAAGFGDDEVCVWADITEAELDQMCRMDKHLAKAREEKKNAVNLAARVNIANAIVKDKDTKISMRYLERTDPEFSGKQNVTLEGAPIVVSIEEKQKAMEEMLDKFTIGEFESDK